MKTVCSALWEISSKVTMEAECGSTSLLSIFCKKNGDRRGLTTRESAIKPCCPETQAFPGVGVGARSILKQVYDRRDTVCHI